jgi:hypothetical protein
MIEVLGRYSWDNKTKLAWLLVIEPQSQIIGLISSG